MASGGRAQAKETGSSVTPSSSARIRMERISNSADAATRAASALDLESDEVPEKLKCPICMEVPLGEVLQCPNGHTICKPCQIKSTRLTCAQCKEPMKSASGGWIRNRFMEEVLDSHWFLCPFRKNGCGAEVLSREDVLKHKEECKFDGGRIQICKYFRNNLEKAECLFYTQLSKPTEALEHLENCHFDYFTNVDEGQEELWWFPVDNKNRLSGSEYVEAAVTRQNGGIFMTVGWSNRETGQISFVCLRMDKPATGQPEPTTAKLTFENQQKESKIPNWSLMIPIVSVTEAKPILERKEMRLVSVYRQYLEEKFLDNGFRKPHVGCLKVIIEIL